MARLAYIRRVQGIGLALEEVAVLLRALDAGGCPCGPALELVEAKLRQCEAEIRSLARRRRILLELRGRLLAVGSGEGPCACAM